MALLGCRTRFVGQQVTPAQSRMARGVLRWSLEAAAKEAKIAKATLVRFEKGGNVMLFGYLRLKEAYEAHGVRFEGKTGVHVEER